MGAVVVKDSEHCSYLSSLVLGIRADLPASQAYQNCGVFERLEGKLQNLVYPSCVGTIRYLERTGRF